MKNKLLLILCFYFLLIPSSIGNAEGKRELDGYEWAKNPIVWKLGFVRGWVTGGHLSINKMSSAFFNLHVLLSIKGIILPDGRRGVIKFKTFTEGAAKEAGLEFFDITFGQIVDMIDNIYSDPRTKKWEIDKIMPLVRGRLKGGWTEKDLDEVIAYKIKLEEWEKNFEKEMGNKEFTEKLGKEFSLLMASRPNVLTTLETFWQEW